MMTCAMDEECTRHRDETRLPATITSSWFFLLRSPYATDSPPAIAQSTMGPMTRQHQDFAPPSGSGIERNQSPSYVQEIISGEVTPMLPASPYFVMEIIDRAYEIAFSSTHYHDEIVTDVQVIEGSCRNVVTDDILDTLEEHRSSSFQKDTKKNHPPVLQ